MFKIWKHTLCSRSMDQIKKRSSIISYLFYWGIGKCGLNWPIRYIGTKRGENACTIFYDIILFGNYEHCKKNLMRKTAIFFAFYVCKPNFSTSLDENLKMYNILKQTNSYIFYLPSFLSVSHVRMYFLSGSAPIRDMYNITCIL